MNKKITFLLFILCGFSMNAQYYTFQKLNEPYVSIQDAVSVNEGIPWDDFEFELTLPFGFVFNNIEISSVILNDSFIVFDEIGDISHVGSPFGNDLIDRSLDEENSASPISYKTEGNVGSRILKIQYSNCGAFADDSLAMFVNFQIWLYETSNIVEFRYGQSLVTNMNVFYDGSPGPVVALSEFDVFNEIPLENSVFLTGNASNPGTSNAISFLNETPANTTVYRFTPASLSNDSFHFADVNIYPNPVHTALYVSTEKSIKNYSIIDISGKKVLEGNLNSSRNSINVEPLQQGIYFVLFEGTNPQKFVKN